MRFCSAAVQSPLVDSLHTTERGVGFAALWIELDGPLGRSESLGITCSGVPMPNVAAAVTPESASWVLLATGFGYCWCCGVAGPGDWRWAGAMMAAVAGVGAGAASAQTLSISGVTFISPGSATNYSTSPTVNVGGAGAYQGLIAFDLSGLPAGVTSASVAKASITLFVNKLGTTGNIDVYAANGPWTETTVNGTNAPTPGMVVASQVPVNAASTYVTVDATALVKAWLDGTTANSGILIAADAGSPATSVLFDSKESSSTSHPAILQITLTGTGAQGPTGPQGPQGPAGPQGVSGQIGPHGADGCLRRRNQPTHNLQLRSGRLAPTLCSILSPWRLLPLPPRRLGLRFSLARYLQPHLQRRQRWPATVDRHRHFDRECPSTSGLQHQRHWAGHTALERQRW